MMATLLNLHAQASESVGEAPDDAANGERDGPGRRQLTNSGQPAGDLGQGITVRSFNLARHPGLRRPTPAAELTASSYFTRSVSWSCSMIVAGMRAFARQWRVGRTVRALEKLHDATLKDLGIGRSEIVYLARTLPHGRWDTADHAVTARSLAGKEKP